MDDRLIAILDRSGVVDGPASDARIEVLDTGAFNSRTVRLRITPPGSATARAFILKQPTDVAWSVASAADEARFYRLIDSLDDHPPVVPRCFAIGSADEPYVLLEDLSATHVAPTTRDRILASGLPIPTDQDAVIDCLARLQAYWWEHPLQGTGALDLGYWSEDGEGFARFAERRRTSWRTLRSANEDWLPASVVERCERIVDGLSAYWTRRLQPRVAERRRLTLVHGDAYFSNFLCPIRAGGTASLIDWQDPCFDLGAVDLANLIATFWTREQRQEDDRERRLLARFHRTLVDHGVAGYSYEMLLEDYRLGLVYWLLVPFQDAHDGSSADYWWPKLQCLLAAFEDWDCDELVA
ncbi:phosphotransferase [Microlunatus speluncae]|uniref:phosphotransferase n=1 Tax=Microlunatus speluncae TaxID=2594267 RepID=UPI001375EFD9|nr:phosphotransferase [Microlunatus speluncae]